MSYFPMYIELAGRACLVAGGGIVACRKVRVLQDFGAEVTVIAPEILPEILACAGVHCQKRDFMPEDIEEKYLVVAATDDKAKNHEIADLCKRKKIPVNAVDQIEDCTFIFPAYVRQGEVVAAFSSGGQSPVITQYLKQAITPVMSEHLGRLAEFLGSLRDEVKACVETEAKRKALYQEVLIFGLSTGEILTRKEWEAILAKYKK